MLRVALTTVLLLAGRSHALNAATIDSAGHSLNVSFCPGYSLQNLQGTLDGFTASLVLAGPACNAYGNDVVDLTLEVNYDSQSRLHVHIYDTAGKQFQIPESVISRPTPAKITPSTESDFEFNYNASPFEFWITRRSDSEGATPLFDTRQPSLPAKPIPPLNANDARTSLDGFALTFEDQYLQLTSALPLNANIYGLGEAVASSGFRRNVGIGNSSERGVGTIQTMWARDKADPIDENMYGMHPFYMEHRLDQESGTARSHGVFLLNSAGSDILLLTPPASNTSLIQYRAIGGTLDLYFLSGPSPLEVVEQYGEIVGLPAWQPYWSFGFQLCRWGYSNIRETREQVVWMREADIPLEVMWNDIDLYHSFRDFTTDPVSFPSEDVRSFIRELASNNQHYIPIVDVAVAKSVNDTDVYDPYTSGAAQNVFITNSNGSEHVGQVWPGYTVFPDWFAENTQHWWTDALRNWSTEGGVEFSGIWLDMNEPASFCEGSCGSNADLSKPPTLPFGLPGFPTDDDVAGSGRFAALFVENMWRPWMETLWNWSAVGWAKSKGIWLDMNASDSSGEPASDLKARGGDATVSSTLSGRSSSDVMDFTGGRDEMLLRQSRDFAESEAGVDLNDPPYAIHNGFERLSINTVATNAITASGYTHLDVHNLYGLMEEQATYAAVQEIIPEKRPFLISRSTFPSSGKWTGHWLGDNFSKWEYMYYSIQGVLQFQLFQIPMVGADTCGFVGDTTEELCNRWMQLSAFTPFYRNHNALGAIPQEPFRWDSVSSASRTAIAVRYALLPYWYTLFANASTRGTPPIRALFWEFPDESELFVVDRQFLVGRDILVTPVLEPSVSTVDGIFPGRGKVTWRDWYTHDVVNAVAGGITTLNAPLGHINVHIRDGAILLLHAKPAYTTTETRAGPFALLISLSLGVEERHAFGTVYIDDGVSLPPGSNTTLVFHAQTSSSGGRLTASPTGSYDIAQKLTRVTILGVGTRPESVKLQDEMLRSGSWTFEEGKGRLVVEGGEMEIDLNKRVTLEWA